MPVLDRALRPRRHSMSATRVQSMTRRRLSAAVTGPLMAALLAAAMTVSGCTTHIGDSVPAAIGGLPEHTPARPTTQSEFPAIGDQPQARSEVLLNEAERKKLKDDLNASRDRAAKLAPKLEPPANEQPAKKKVATPAASKKKSEPTSTGSVSAAGATPNP
jgi:hypothetical protein